MNVALLKKSTNVRFVLLSVAVAVASAACSLSAPRIAQRDSCGAGLRAICGAVGESVGGAIPGRSCECVPQPEIDRFLRALGQPAALGGAY
jgi:hypothetical protein